MVDIPPVAGLLRECCIKQTLEGCVFLCAKRSSIESCHSSIFIHHIISFQWSQGFGLPNKFFAEHAKALFGMPCHESEKNLRQFIIALTAECARSARAACAAKCKEKRQNRHPAKICYEMRKIDAEKRPRFKVITATRSDHCRNLAALKLWCMMRCRKRSVLCRFLSFRTVDFVSSQSGRSVPSRYCPLVMVVSESLNGVAML